MAAPGPRVEHQDGGTARRRRLERVADRARCRPLAPSPRRRRPPSPRPPVRRRGHGCPARVRCWSRGRAVLLADVHPAGEGDPPVDHQDLAVVAERLEHQMREEGMEQPHLDASSPHLAPEGAAGGERSPGVGQHLDDDSALHRSRDHVEEGEPGAIVLQDVGLDQDLASSPRRSPAARRRTPPLRGSRRGRGCLRGSALRRCAGGVERSRRRGAPSAARSRAGRRCRRGARAGSFVRPAVAGPVASAWRTSSLSNDRPRSLPGGFYLHRRPALG